MKTQVVDRIPNHILPVIVLAQFCCTSLWFAGNAILPELTLAFDLGTTAVANLTSAVQLGFIGGTFAFAILNIADQFSPSKVFLLSALMGALFNSLIIIAPFGVYSLWIYRFLTGFFLAGIYPVGMKIAADWYQGRLGKALGYLVGALVLGTAFPHLVRSFNAVWSWPIILWIISGISIIGGLLIIFLVPDGPNRKKRSPLKLTAFISIFKVAHFRAAAFGYFGHMWELYTLWAFTPLILDTYSHLHVTPISISFWSFIIIGSGFLGCVLGGYFALKRGSARVAVIQLSISGLCCLLSFFMINFPAWIFLFFLVIWGTSVVGDSPQFSTLVAQTAPKEYTGTALTITNSIGFAITIISIQLMGYLISNFPLVHLMPILGIGPLFGLLSMKRLLIK